MLSNFIRVCCAFLLCSGLGSLCNPSLAQSYPSKPIRFLVPFAPGGIGDLTARLVAQKISENIGHQVASDNRPSAGMIVTAEAARKADPDGYTILLTDNGTAVSASLFKSVPYDALTDFIQVFGASRIAWGSNFPALEGSLEMIADESRRALAFLPAADQEWIFWRTAQSLYPALAD